ncbi:MAG: TlpA family protein disulfide reductase [Alphaproteobacteria bacterium]
MNATTVTPTRTDIPPQGRAEAHRVYLNDHVNAEMFKEHMHFPRGVLAPGDRLGSYDLLRLDGTLISSADLFAEKPVLLIAGSSSCPMTAASMAALKRLYECFGAAIDFVMLNVREAHPGEKLPQPKQLGDKLDRARLLQAELAIPFPVVSDDLSGALHRALGALPNAAFLVDRDGVILFRALWAGDNASLRRALDAVRRGERPPEAQSERKLLPMAQGLGEMREKLESSGSRAIADVWKAAPQLAVVAWTAGLFRPLPPLMRTAAATGLLLGVPLVVARLALNFHSAHSNREMS